MTYDLSTIVSIAIGFLGIGIMVLVHELGHLVAARIFDIEVESLQFGFGPAIFKWKGKKYNTSFQLGIIPFGGFCRMKGQDDLTDAINNGLEEISNQSKYSISQVHPLKRIITYLAGPLSNIIFAFICYSILLACPVISSHTEPRIVLQADYPGLYSKSISASKDAGLKTGDTIVSVNGVETPYYDVITKILSENKNASELEFITSEGKKYYVRPQDGLFGILPYLDCIVDNVKKDSPEYNAGLRRGDRIISVNGVSVTNIFDIFTISKNCFDLSLQVISEGQDLPHIVSFTCINSVFNFSLKSIQVKEKGLPVKTAFSNSFSQCFKSFISNIKSVFLILSGKNKPSETVSTTFKASMNMGLMTTKSFTAGLNNGLRMVLYLMSTVSISLAVANLLPITAFDGGLILISTAELIAGHSFSPKTYLALQTGGLITVLLIIVLLRFF